MERSSRPDDWSDDDGEGAESFSTDPLPPPTERAWRHPSELAAPVPGPVPRSGQWAFGVVPLGLAVASVVGLIAVAAIRSDRNVTTQVADIAPPPTVDSATVVSVTTTIASVASPVTPPTSLTSVPTPTTRKPATTTTTTTVLTAVTAFEAVSSGPTTTVAGVVRLTITGATGASREATGIRVDESTVVVPVDRWLPDDTVTVTNSDGEPLAVKIAGHDPSSRLAVLDVIGAAPGSSANLGSCRDLEAGGAVDMTTDGNARNGVVTSLAMDATGDTTSSPFVKVDSDSQFAHPPIVSSQGVVFALGLWQKGQTTTAVPVDVVKAAIETIRAGTAATGKIGLTGRDVEGEGAVVEAVDPGSPAELAGLRPGDVIISVDGRPVRSWFDLLLAVRSSPPGTALNIETRTTSADGARSERETAVTPAQSW